MFRQAFNQTRQRPVAARVRSATTMWERGRGLLGTRELPAGDGLWISPCTSVHTFFMRYPIDVLFLNAENVVIGAQTLRPWRISSWHRRSSGVLELPAGALQESATQIGDAIAWRNA